MSIEINNKLDKLLYQQQEMLKKLKAIKNKLEPETETHFNKEKGDEDA